MEYWRTTTRVSLGNTLTRHKRAFLWNVRSSPVDQDRKWASDRLRLGRWMLIAKGIRFLFKVINVLWSWPWWWLHIYYIYIYIYMYFMLKLSRSVVSDSLRPHGPWTVAHQAPRSMEFSGKNTGVGSHFLLQGIFLNQELSLHLLHCRQILYLWDTWEATLYIYIDFTLYTCMYYEPWKCVLHVGEMHVTLITLQ